MHLSAEWNSIAIVGAGPAGSTLATFLAHAGKKVVLFNPGKRPPLLVGESLIPAVIPILRRLGVEDEVKSYSMYKPGATFRMDAEENHYGFSEFGDKFPHYAYNVPRDKFDDTLKLAAQAAGAHFVEALAKLEKSENGAGVDLVGESLESARDALGSKPDLIVDASGRNRLFANLLELPSTPGKRRDTVLFAHIDGANTTREGNIHIGRLEYGWHWFIPLPDRMSMGVVMDGERLKTYGDTNEERYDHLLANEPMLSEYAGDAKRLTPVMKYTNYQMVTKRCVGEGWALVGDAAGFIDPIFSSGLFLGMDGATHLADAILGGGLRAMDAYQAYATKHIQAWQHIVDCYYAGLLFTLFKIGRERPPSFFSRPFRHHIFQHMGRIFTGQAATNGYSLWLLDFITKYGVGNADHGQLRIN